MLIDSKLVLNGTKVILFDDNCKNSDDYLDYGVIVDSEIASFGTDYVIKYSVLGKDGSRYECSYKDSFFNNIYFFTIEEYINHLKNQINELGMIVDKKRIIVDELNRFLEKDNSNISNNRNINTNDDNKSVPASRVIPTPIFFTKEQEEMFFKCAKESMNVYSELSWDGKDEYEDDDDDKVYTRD